MTKLGVNIDHVATIRNARGESHPDPFFVAKNAIKFGADSITIHLREDRRHINENDLKIISKKKFPLNLEMAANSKMLKIALKYKPNYVCIVQEKRQELTTEGGLNLKKNKKKLQNIIKILNYSKIRTSLFINPSLKDIETAKSYVEAFLTAQNSGSGVAVVNGKIVENLHVEMAKNILHKVELIEKKKM